MHNAMTGILYLLLIFTCFSCTAKPKATSSAVKEDTPFALVAGDSVRFTDGERSLWIYLQSIEDNRCPVDVNCITGGKASVTLLLKNKANLIPFCIGADCREEKDIFLIEHNNESYNIVLESVEPYPQSGNEKEIKRAIFKIKQARVSLPSWLKLEKENLA